MRIPGSGGAESIRNTGGIRAAKIRRVFGAVNWVRTYANSRRMPQTDESARPVARLG